ncbi:helix-turn-helix domain-containing protein [Caulobacter sp. NIBR2454]|uniref:helix-turn-helix domain-containing protein n=1 Tax=Caulobacter sp. NIBR2454 TaxID=3015996 RepID=UPI0022B64513|nr:helix-turn-helix domain-containing protein [Caulobacter sp. NIBR2454]
MTAMDKLDSAPNPTDVHVGARIRLRRKHLGISQTQLAEGLSLTFQQVQKYERGVNRVSASKLYDMARTMGVPISYFFDGLPDPTAATPADITALDDQQAVQAFLLTPEGLEIARAFPKISSAAVRRRVVQLVTSMTDDDREENAA